MAKVKNIKVKTIALTVAGRTVGYYWNYKTFTTFTDDNGNKIYLINGNEVTKEAGNEAYLKLKESNRKYQTTKDCKDYIKREWTSFYKLKKTGRWSEKDFTLHEVDTFKQEIEEYEISYEEIIENLKKSIDHYTQYIDDGKQREQAEANNHEIRTRIAKLEQLIAER